MNRLGIALALALASVTSIACTAPSDDGQDEEVAEAEENVQTQQQQLSCQRFPKDTCVSVGAYCRRRGGELWCDLYGNCTCRYPVLQASPAFAP